MQDMLKVAREAARAAEEIILHYYDQGVTVDLKPDNTPVTRADVEAEQAIRETLGMAFPDFGFYGEETGQSAMEADYLWLVDPIDGTKSFVRHYPMFSTQIALMHRGELVLGVSNAPAFEEMAWAVKGEGAFLNGRPIRVSGIDSYDQAALSTGNIGSLAQDPNGWSRLGGLARQVQRTRGYGDFLHYHLLARGAIDIIVESDLNILDIAALTVIVREAGGVMTQLDGGPIGLETRSVLAAPPALHARLLRHFNG